MTADIWATFYDHKSNAPDVAVFITSHGFIYRKEDIFFAVSKKADKDFKCEFVFPLKFNSVRRRRNKKHFGGALT